MKKSIPTDFRAEQRALDDLSFVMEGEHASLQGLVHRRLKQTLKARRNARVAVAEASVANHPNATSEIDSRDLLELLGQLNQPQHSRVLATC